jgi:hypothetical protein
MIGTAMAEVVLVHFKTADWTSLRPVLDTMADWSDQSQWWMCPSESDCCALLYEYDDMLNELEDAVVDELVQALGDLPNSSLGIQLGRSVQARACDIATDVSVRLLEQFEGIADDTDGGYWTLQELQQQVRKHHGCFLDCYRYPGRYRDEDD